MTDTTIRAQPPQAGVLCIDDEPGVCAALSRLLGRDGHRVLTAGSGCEGLQVLEHESVQVVISDLHMPGMDGIECLTQVRSRWPETVRMLLTGHGDMSATVAAINHAGVSRYIAKPWDDAELRLAVRTAAEHQFLATEKRRLDALTQAQNRELQELNAELEARIEAALAELRHEHTRVLVANEKLKTGFIMSINVFSHLVELGEARYPGHSRRVAHMARRIAKAMGLGHDAVQDVLIAGLLHNIGKLGLPEAIRSKPVALMDEAEQQLYRSHPGKGAAILMAVPELRIAATLLRAQHERFDGHGFPDRLCGDQIPLGGRILAVANDFDALQIGAQRSELQGPGEAANAIRDGRGTNYDPAVVDALLSIFPNDAISPVADDLVLHELALPVEQLEPGMTLSRDLISRDGLLLVAAGHVLDEEIIGLMRQFLAAEAEPLSIHINGDTVP